MKLTLKFIKKYLQITEEISELSYCKRKQVGCLIVKDDNILSFGYNGTPSGLENCCEDNIDNETLWYVLHSESNAILKCAKNGLSTKDSIIFITLSPCKECSKLILQAGIKTLYFINKYSNTEGLDFLKENGIEIFQFIKEKDEIKMY